MTEHRKEHDNPRISERKLFHCNHCEETFDDKNKLMKHKKGKHSEKVSICRQYLSGSCNFVEKHCLITQKLLQIVLNASIVEMISKQWVT